MKHDIMYNALYKYSDTPQDVFSRYFIFRELYTVHLLMRNFFWEQNVLYPDQLHVPSAVSLAGKDHIIPTMSIMRVLQFENRRRKLQRDTAASSKRRKSLGSAGGRSESFMGMGSWRKQKLISTRLQPLLPEKVLPKASTSKRIWLLTFCT